MGVPRVRLKEARMQALQYDGDSWDVVNTGAYRDGTVYCHLASRTRFCEQRNGRVPVQVADFITAEQVEAALDRPRGFFAWNRALRGAFERGERDHREGAGLDACPYQDKRKSGGGLTWSRAYQTAWRDGYAFAREQAAKHASRKDAIPAK